MNDKQEPKVATVCIEATALIGAKVQPLPKPKYFYQKFIAEYLRKVRTNKPKDSSNPERP